MGSRGHTCAGRQAGRRRRFGYRRRPPCHRSRTRASAPTSSPRVPERASVREPAAPHQPRRPHPERVRKAVPTGPERTDFLMNRANRGTVSSWSPKLVPRPRVHRRCDGRRPARRQFKLPATGRPGNASGVRSLRRVRTAFRRRRPAPRQMGYVHSILRNIGLAFLSAASDRNHDLRGGSAVTEIKSGRIPLKTVRLTEVASGGPLAFTGLVAHRPAGRCAPPRKAGPRNRRPALGAPTGLGVCRQGIAKRERRWNRHCSHGSAP